MQRVGPLLALSGHPKLHRTCPLSGGKADMTYCSIHRTKAQNGPLNSYTVIFVLFSHLDPHSFLQARLYSSTAFHNTMKKNARTTQKMTGCFSMNAETLSFIGDLRVLPEPSRSKHGVRAHCRGSLL
jgi:hypothetical protein